MRQISIVLVVLTALIPVSLSAQSVSGNVVDAQSGEPLVGANIVVSSLQIGTITDHDGAYALRIGRKGTYRITYRFLGYRTEFRDVEISGDALEIGVQLTPSAIEWDLVTVTAKSRESDILSTPQPIAVVDRDEMERHRGAAAFDALANTEGVRLLRTGEGVAKPMIRGLTSQRVVVVQDEVRQEGQQWGDEHGPELDAFAINRIEVVKGPASLLYGSDALGGVVHALSDGLFDLSEPIGGSATVLRGSSNRLGAAGIVLAGRSGGYVYEASSTFKRAGSLSTPDGLIDNSGLEMYHLRARAGQSLAYGHYLLSYSRSYAKLGLFEPDEEEEGHNDQEHNEAHDEPGRFEIGLPYQGVEHQKFGAHVEHALGAHRVVWTTGVQSNRRKEFEHEHEEHTVAKSTAVDPALHLQLTTISSDVRFHHAPVGIAYGTIGLSGSVQRNRTLGEEHLIPTGTTWNGALYVTEEIVLPSATLSGGVRFDHRDLSVETLPELDVVETSRRYDQLSGAIGAAWHPGSGLSLAVNAGRAWRGPALIELFGNGVHEGTIRFERGDADLQAEKSLSIDGVIRWITEHHSLEISLFRNGIDDYIFLRRTGETDGEFGYEVYQYEQAPATIWGGEFRLDLHPHPYDWVHLGVSGDLTRGRNTRTDSDLPFMPPDRVRLELGLSDDSFGRKATDARIDFGVTLVDDQRRVGQNEAETKGYAVMDVSASIRFETGPVVIRPVLSVRNLTDRRYLDHLNRYRAYDVPAAGRSLNASVIVDF